MFEKQIQAYLFQTGQYSVIGETIDNLSQLKMEDDYLTLVQYMLSKTLLFFAFRLKDSIERRNNILRLDRFPEFCQSGSAEYILGKIDLDINRWLPNFNLFYFSLEYHGKHQEVLNVITDSIVEKDFDKDLKVPLRLVLDPIFKNTYKTGKNAQDPVKAEKICRICLQILLCMTINNIFDKKHLESRFQLYFKDEPAFTFWRFSSWLEQSRRPIILKQIHVILEKAFGKQKLDFFLKNY